MVTLAGLEIFSGDGGLGCEPYIEIGLRVDGVEDNGAGSDSLVGLVQLDGGRSNEPERRGLCVGCE